MSTPQVTDAYREQLVRWCQTLAAGRIEAVCDALADGEAQDVARFLTQTVVERRELLRQELTFVALAFDDFDALVEAYLGQSPLTAYDPECSDRERFVRWLQEVRPLTTKQREFVAYQLAEYAVAAEARKRRAEHLAFQRAWRQVGNHLARLPGDPALRIHLNPIRAWSRLALPGHAVSDVLFFAAGDSVASAVPGQVERGFLQVLARGPCTLAEYASELWPASREQLASLCRDRAAEGLLAFE